MEHSGPVCSTGNTQSRGTMFHVEHCPLSSKSSARLGRALLVVSLSAIPIWAQTPASNVTAATLDVQPALTQALLGRWVGVLEYRDYSEPATSLKRVQLPTWLTVSTAAEGLATDYTYDDGPTKVVTSHSVLV